ncbi:hypothetical protein Axi01nite_80340 [Actinoplanes xinjiangensis]|nr:hypothetical protein Axi01nite_80340 [Actinoplanes xinjiangensis]
MAGSRGSTDAAPAVVAAATVIATAAADRRAEDVRAARTPERERPKTGRREKGRWREDGFEEGLPEEVMPSANRTRAPHTVVQDGHFEVTPALPRFPGQRPADPATPRTWPDS